MPCSIFRAALHGGAAPVGAGARVHAVHPHLPHGDHGPAASDAPLRKDDDGRWGRGRRGCTQQLHSVVSIDPRYYYLHPILTPYPYLIRTYL